MPGNLKELYVHELGFWTFLVGQAFEAVSYIDIKTKTIVKIVTMNALSKIQENT
jgi:hypothetical protein